MITGSRKIPITIHVYRFPFDCHDDRHNSGMAVLAQEQDAQVPRGLNLYTRFAYGLVGDSLYAALVSR